MTLRKNPTRASVGAVAGVSERDFGWMAALMARRREQYRRYAARFWRPAKQCEEQRAGFMRLLAAQPNATALRTDHGFILVQRRGDQAFVDDFAVDDAERWSTDGDALLHAAWADQRDRGATHMRVVTARLDTEGRDAR